MQEAAEQGPVDAGRAVFGISVAAELSGVAVQSLRLYETRGLLEPDRTTGGTRRYSSQDVHRARRINQLLDDGLNLTGIAAVLALEAENAALRMEIDGLRRRLRRPRR
ncbi:MAG TPA: MerR family transcriptional regulator [Mycobacteriales bacterium]|nr:MerR family transcriptional regulator [Mycobacteriales bacterium]